MDSQATLPVLPPAPKIAPDVLQYLVDQAANLNLFSVPSQERSDVAIRDERGSIIGFQIAETLRRFQVVTSPPTAKQPMRATNVIGEVLARLTHRWMLIPPDYVGTSKVDPPQTAFDPNASEPQRFVMLDSRFTLDGGSGEFRGFGSGKIFPMTMGGERRFTVTAIGTVLGGSDQFNDHNEGTYLYCGSFSPERGFTGNVFLRLMDRDGSFSTDRVLPEIEPWKDPEPDFTYLMFRGQALPADSVAPNVSPDGQPLGLIVVQGLRLLEVDCATRGHQGLRSTFEVGQTFGKITATVAFNPAAPGGTNLDPIPFTTSDEFVFFDHYQKQVAMLHGDSNEGRVFHTAVGGAQAIRFGGVGDIQAGNETMAGMRGLMTDNSVVVFNPHVSASVYILRVHDPERRYRIA